MKTLWIFMSGLIMSALVPLHRTQTYDLIFEQLVKKQHILDNLNLLIFNILLIATLLTVWLFKHRRIPYLHETGLALIYGLICGSIIKYGIKKDKFSSQTLTAKVQLMRGSKNYSADFFPTNLLLSLHGNFVNFSVFGYKLTNKVLYKANANSLEDTDLENKLTFDPEVFFNVLLPPIIFNAGYSLNRVNFFNNIGTIITFAFVGTVISTFVSGSLLFALTLIWPSLGFRFSDCLFFGATISATDPVTVLAIFNDLKVDSLLYSLVFGESVLNDAIAMVLALTIDKYVGADGSKLNLTSFIQTLWRFCTVFMGSLAIGFIMGFVTAIMTKYTKIREFPLLETSLFFLMSYSTFLMAEVSELSGIVAVLFAGIFQAHYTFHNLSRHSQLRTRQIYELMSFLIENFIFCYIGVSMFTFQNHKFHLGLIISAFIAIFVSRICNVYPLSFLLNLGRNKPIPLNTQHMFMFSGLRGAVAFALALRNTSTTQRRALCTTTSLIVIITVLFCGSTTTKLLEYLNIRTGVDENNPELRANFANVGKAKKTSSLERKDSNNKNTYSYSQQNTEVESRVLSNGQIISPYKQFTNQNDDDGNGEKFEVSVSSHPQANIVPDTYSHNFLVRTWGYLDYKFLKPLLTQTQPSLMITLPKFWYPIAKILTTTEQMRRHTEAQLIVNANADDTNTMMEYGTGSRNTPPLTSTTNNNLSLKNGNDKNYAVNKNVSFQNNAMDSDDSPIF